MKYVHVWWNTYSFFNTLCECDNQTDGQNYTPH